MKAGIDKLENNMKRVLILGVGGFIGTAIAARLLAEDNYLVCGLDMRAENISEIIDHPRFTFLCGDVRQNADWVEEQVALCDVVLPLIAVATPIAYIETPLRVFELDFEENLKIVKLCHKYKKRVIFPSTSEVYGMCDDDDFDEETSRFVLGPIQNQRWIYSCGKQMLDRVIWAYGGEGLEFTLFRPFNWIGPKLDSLEGAKVKHSRVITQFIWHLVAGEPIQLVDGGAQKRSFTDIDDGTECLFRIIENRQGACNGKIINIGNPANEFSIKELAEIIVEQFEQHPLRREFPAFAGLKIVNSMDYYGKGYQDCSHRRPSIKNAKQYCDWEPHTSLRDSVKKMLDYFLPLALSDKKQLLVK